MTLQWRRKILFRDKNQRYQIKQDDNVLSITMNIFRTQEDVI